MKAVSPTTSSHATADAARLALDLYEDLRFGFRLDAEGLRDESRRFAGGGAPGPTHGTSRPISRESQPFVGRDGLLEPVAARVAASFARGAALELSGGVDSRFVLALGLAAGERPRRAITIDTGGADAGIAVELARRYGIEHRVVRFEEAADARALRSDAVAFVEASGGRANATVSACFPGVFRQVAGFRDEQIGGVGGEVAAGFYHTPIDAIWPRLPLGLWIRLRLAAPGDGQVEVFEPRARRELAEASLSRVRAALAIERLPELSWRDRVDALYREYRLGNWAAATLQASSSWYRVTMPLMSDAYFEWALGVPAVEHRGKFVQRGFVERVDRSLASVPYAVEADAAGKRARGAKLLRKWRRVVERIGRQARPAPKLAQDAAVTLASDAGFRGAILELAAWRSGALGLSSEGLRRMVEDPARHALELGALATAAIRAGLLDGD